MSDGSLPQIGLFVGNSFCAFLRTDKILLQNFALLLTGTLDLVANAVQLCQVFLLSLFFTGNPHFLLMFFC